MVMVMMIIIEKIYSDNDHYNKTHIFDNMYNGKNKLF